MSKEILVSIICMAYNQEKYIAQTLDTILTQKTNFDFEIIVHDDKSTDSTTEIIHEYEKKYPDVVKPIYEQKNQYSTGKDVFMGLCMPHANGKYIAVCEGDDYWIDNNKLQLQFDTMEVHQEVDMCACGAIEITGNVETQEIRPKAASGILTVEEVILGGGRFLATNSLFFRKELFASFMEFEKIICFDYSNQIKGALRGGIYYIDRKMAVYRRATENSWTRRIEHNKKKREEHIKKEVAMLRQLDVDTGGKYHKCIEQRITAYTPFFEQLMSHREEVLEELSNYSEDIYLWGLGMRGDAMQEFCQCEHIILSGVCDKKNDSIGEKTVYDFTVVDTEYVMNNGNVIIVSNNAIYESLTSSGFSGQLINLQKYMPLS